MATDTEAGTPSPDDAFAVLGDETRIAILRTLGEADDPLSFSELRDRVGVEDSGGFNYHLDRLRDHFVRRTEEGYDLRGAGRRVVEAVLSGTVTESPTIEHTEIDVPCQFCGAPIVVGFREERVESYCTECRGLFGRDCCVDGPDAPEGGYLGYLPIPPAGVEGRDPEELYRAAWTWANLEIMSMAAGVCPRCSATVEYSVDVCGNHDPGGTVCGECDRRKAVGLHVDCTNCIFDVGGTINIGLVANTDLLAFLTEHGLNPVAPEAVAAVNRVHDAFEEEVVSEEPFEARFTFGLEGDTLTLTVDEDLEVRRGEGGDGAPE
ncbi:MAG: ArsR/SmtB family transcription factor [Halobacteriales archaeon]